MDCRHQLRLLVSPHLGYGAIVVFGMFRVRFLAAVNVADLHIPQNLPRRWIVDVKLIGAGKPALEYLSVYPYRGVIRENKIDANRHGKISFQYIDSATGKTQTRTLAGEDFLWLVLQHVLPKGFRCVRDYGFLHSKAKRRLTLVQLVLRVVIDA